MKDLIEQARSVVGHLEKVPAAGDAFGPEVRDLFAEIELLRAALPADEYARIGLLEWAVTRWREDVQYRPLVNIYRAGMDKAYRCVIRHAGGDPEAIIGPAHSELVARDIEASKAHYAPGVQPLSAPLAALAQPSVEAPAAV